MIEDNNSNEMAMFARAISAGEDKLKSTSNEMISFGDMISLLRKKILMISCIAAVLSVIVFGIIQLTYKTTFTYVSVLHAIPNINEKGLDVGEINLRYLLYGDSIKNVAQMVTENSIAIKSLKNSNINTSYMKKWKNNVDIEVVPNTGIIEITVKSNDENEAKSLNASLLTVINAQIASTYPNLSIKVNTDTAKLLDTSNKLFYSFPGLIIIFFFMILMVYMVLLVSSFFGTKIINENDLIKITDFPLIIKSTKGKEKRTAFLTNSIISSMKGTENFRTLLWYSFSKDIQGASIIIDSANLICMKSKKVVIIDADFKNKLVSSKIGANSQKGVLEFMKGEITPDNLSGFIKTTNDGTDIIPAGVDNVDKYDFINRIDKIEVLVNLLKEKYDYVFVSAVPFAYAQECTVISKYVDASLLLLKQNSVVESKVADACKILTQLKAKVVGFIITDSFSR